MGGGGGGSGPTVQQQQLETQQALTSANLNLEENAQRKAILNSMMGTRVFRGSALSRAVRGNTPGNGGEAAAPAPSKSQLTNGATPIVTPGLNILGADQSGNTGGGTPAGGAGGSAQPSNAGGYRGGGGSRGGGAQR